VELTKIIITVRHSGRVEASPRVHRGELASDGGGGCGAVTDGQTDRRAGATRHELIIDDDDVLGNTSLRATTM